MPWMACKVEPPNTPVHGIGLTPDAKKLWITSVSDAGVYVYDIASKKLGKKITVGACPNWIGFSADGKYAGVSNADSDGVHSGREGGKRNRPRESGDGAQKGAGDRGPAGPSNSQLTR